jgi:pseudouridine-5'-phosphate glycosidase/pseudouridine kinase
VISGHEPVRSSFQPPPITPPPASPVATPPPAAASTFFPASAPAAPAAPATSTPPAPQALVLGALAVDILCDPLSTPIAETSNPSTITESLGGVAGNVAYALHLSGIPTRLVAAVGNDASGRWAVEKLGQRGMETGGVKTVDMGTPRYVAINDSKGGLFVAAADMRAVEQGLDTEIVRGEVGGGLAEWVVIDGNLSEATITAVLKEAGRKGKKGIIQYPYSISHIPSPISYPIPVTC